MTDKINILVVDDMPDKLMAMQAILDELGENVVAVQSGREALRKILDQEFAVILLDVNMPDIDGFETAALIRRRKKTEHTPIIFVTSYSDEAHAWQGYSLGAVDYILAPVVPEVLRTKVGVFVDLYRKNQQVRQQAEQRVALAQEQAARAAAEALSKRTAFLAEASGVLARSLDYEATVNAALQLAVPTIAAGAGLVVAEERLPFQAQPVFSIDEDNPQLVQSQTLSDLPQAMISGLSQVLQASRADSALDEAAPEGESVFPWGSLGSAIIPLKARGKVVAALWLRHPTSQGHPLDISLAEELADRAAIAIDNARLYREVQEGDRRKDEFLAMLGHELRNPLAAIANALQCLRIADGDPAFSRDAQEVLERQTHQMSRLVDDLLDVSRITRGTVELRKEMVDLGAIVRRAVAATSAAVASRSHRLHAELPAQPIALLADSTRLEQILANLINNAAKFTEPGGEIKLAVELADRDVVIRVADNGIGIPDHLLPHVFDLFIQGDRSLDRAQGGLGIGLTLVRRLVELHGGSVAVSSNGRQRGSEFTVRLPYHVPEKSMKNASSPPVARPNQPGHRVLLVDDNVDLTLTTSALLKLVGHDVMVAADGLSALDVAMTWQPDVVLIDIGLPGLDGYEVARRLRSTGSFDDVLLVAMTGYGQEEDRQRAKEAGFDHHLVKPVDFQHLRDVLASHAPRELLRA